MKKMTDDYYDNTTEENMIENANSSGSSLGEKVKHIARKLKFNSKSSDEDPNTKATAASPPANTTIIEERDLGFTDYLRTQVLGQDDIGRHHNYRRNLDWTEIILDDFS